MICFTWWGLTQYAARAIEAFVKVSKEPVVVAATRPEVPVKGLESVFSCPLIWVEENQKGVADLLPEVPRVLFISNWNLPAWRELENRVRKNGGKTIAFVDTDALGYDFRKAGLKLFLISALRAVRFRLFIRHRFNSIFVAGKSGSRLARYFGVPKDCIFTGLYGADDQLFYNGAPLPDRPKRIIYVGQLIERKNVRRMCEAFLQVAVDFPDWTLELYGSGPLRDELVAMTKKSSIHIHDFAQSQELAELYRSSQVFMLPSVEEHWGVVVHEAALSGCYLLLSDRIGAAEDFATALNATLFDPYDVQSMANAMRTALSLTLDKMYAAQTASLNAASGFGPKVFVNMVRQIVGECA